MSLPAPGHLGEHTYSLHVSCRLTGDQMDLFPAGRDFSAMFEHLGSSFAVIGVTMMIAVAEPGLEFSEIAGPESLPA
jgi:hypothetical protein